MQTYIALLRGINVNGQKLIKMAELLALLQDLDFQNAKTYIQSGNVVFQDESVDTKELGRQIKGKILERFGFDVPVLVKTKPEWVQAIQNNPFLPVAEADNKKVLVTFLSAQPEPINIDKINPEQYTPDVFKIIGNAIYLFCPNGYGQTKLDNNFFEKKLKVTATTRNWRTLLELMNIADAIASGNN